MSNENDEINALSKLTKAELNKYVSMLRSLINNQNHAMLSKNTDSNLLYNIMELNENLPLIKTTYLSQMVKPLDDIRKLTVHFIAKNPNNPYSAGLLQNKHVIDDFFTRFQISEELALSAASLGSPNEDERSLYQRVLNPYARGDEQFNGMIKKIAKSIFSTGETASEMKTVADTIKAEYEGAPAPVDPGLVAVSELFLAGANKIKEEQDRYKLSKAKLAELSKEEPLDSRAQARKKIDKLLASASEDVLRGKN